MTKSEAEEYLKNNMEAIESAYADKYGDDTVMPNLRVEKVYNADDIYDVFDDARIKILISCHYDCGDADHHGAVDCPICHMKDGWDFRLFISGELPGALRVS